jgi:membrane-associated protease RseP (regulator of RpoE activity)
MNWIYIVFLLGFYVIFRKNLEWVFPMFIVRSKKFTKEIYDFGSRHQWALRGFFSVGVFLGFILMVYSFIYLVEGVIQIQEEEIARLSVILPEQEVAGVTFPLIHWILAISITLIVHELGHGIASAAERVKPKNVALVMFLGIIPGAGVEIDNKKLNKLPQLSRLRVIAAGSYMNILVALLIIFINIPLIELGQSYMNFEGILITELEQGRPGEHVLDVGVVITAINDFQLTSLEDVNKIGEQLNPNSEVQIQTDKGLYVLKTDDEGKIGFMGVPQLTYKEDPVSQGLFWFMDLLGWTFLVCVGIGIANMMPLWPFDGGLVVKEVVDRIKINKALVPIYALTLILVLINFFSPQIRALIV